MGTGDLLETLAARADRTAAIPRSLEELIDRSLDDAYRLAAVVLRDPAEAEDAVQDAAVLACRRFRSLREPERFNAWFGRIVVNVCRDRLRTRRRGVVRDAALQASFEPATPDRAEAFARRDALARAISTLSPDLQVVVALRFWRDLTLDAIAELLGIPEGTVKSRLFEATKRLRGQLERDGWTVRDER